MERTHTFITISDAANVTPRTVKGWWDKAKAIHGELGEILVVGGARKFSDDERDTLLDFASERIREEMPKVFVDHGDRSQYIDLGSMPSVATLDAFRGDRVIQRLENPTAFVRSIGSFLDRVEAEMDEAERQQEEELIELKTVKSRTQRRVDSMRLRRERFRIKSDIIATLSAAEISQIQDITNEANSMGKPQAKGSE